MLLIVHKCPEVFCTLGLTNKLVIVPFFCLGKPPCRQTVKCCWLYAMTAQYGGGTRSEKRLFFLTRP